MLNYTEFHFLSTDVILWFQHNGVKKEDAWYLQEVEITNVNGYHFNMAISVQSGNCSQGWHPKQVFHETYKKILQLLCFKMEGV